MTRSLVIAVLLSAGGWVAPVVAQDVYRFGPPKDEQEAYADGTIVPHRDSAIQRQRANGSWETLGYVEIHLHKVKRDATDVEDVSVGVTVRINPRR